MRERTKERESKRVRVREKARERARVREGEEREGVTPTQPHNGRIHTGRGMPR